MGKNLSVRFPDWLYDCLRKEAHRTERSIGGQVRYILGLHYQGGQESHEGGCEEGHGQDRPGGGGKGENLD